MENLKKYASAYDIELSTEELDKFGIYLEFLLEYNKKVNLTAITQPEEVLTKHFIDSLLIVNAYDIHDDATVIDVGTGAGFPGVPLKIVRPDIQLTLLDSLNKRIVFLEQLLDKLSLQADLVHGRAEHKSLEPDFRDNFDVVTSRAVANLASLCEYCLPYVREGGVFLALKGPKVEKEVATAQRALELLGGELVGMQEYSLPDGEERSIVIIEKISDTPYKYPRQGINIGKTPL